MLKEIKTRLGVDKAKPKGWFEYSLQIDKAQQYNIYHL